MASTPPTADLQTKTTFCRVCHASCPMEVDVVDNRVIAVRGVHGRPAVRGVHLHQGSPAPRPDGRPEPTASPTAATPRRHLRAGRQRRGPRRDRRRTSPHHRHLRPARRRVVHRHRRLPELGRGPGALGPSTRASTRCRSTPRSPSTSRPRGSPVSASAAGRRATTTSPTPTSTWRSGTTRWCRRTRRSAGCRAPTRSSSCVAARPRA